MIYTIAVITECCKENPLTVEIGVKGNEYTVSLGREGQYTSNTFKSMADAYKVFEKLSSWLVMGLYPESAKRHFRNWNDGIKNKGGNKSPFMIL